MLYKIALYVAFVVVAGSLISVPMFHAGQWAIETDLIPQLKPFRFPKYLNRGVLVAAIAGLYPFLRSIGVKNLRGLGLVENSRWRRDLALGFTVGAMGLTFVATWLVVSGRIEIKDPLLSFWFLSAAATAIAVALIEEFFFRGALFGILLQQLSARAATLWLSFIFAVLHFIKPHHSVKLWDGEIQWWTGFEVLSYSFWQFSEPRLLVGGLLTLFMVGVVLAYATLKTRSLFLAIGIHAGWVFVLRMVQMGSTRSAPADWWVGRPLITGIIPFGLVTLTGVLIYYYFGRNRNQA
ncbi:MAG: CPBP family intramembrane metalloprotease [Deltaproteobacteria bacterium]|nr:CPBP family intramembrane metalloprotease [Deltaproteobacteria bacterium]MBT6492497.1 CPBP family intramembrane metalloprotease [Deltaproteobacteria bacterium]